MPSSAQARSQADATDSDTPPVPITVRQLEAVIRISESLARMGLQVSAGDAPHGWAGECMQGQHPLAAHLAS